MPSTTSEENQIFSIFSNEGVHKNSAFGHREFEINNTKYFVCATLYSAHLPELETHLEAGLNFFQDNHNQDLSDMLGEMKKTLFASGDFLADHLISQKLPVDDVDYSVCFMAFRDGVVYVWLDGDLNVRIYRGVNSILVNTNREPQFFGSTTAQLGDILTISNYKNIQEPDLDVESYILKEKIANYPGLFLDYQIETASAELPNQEEIQNYAAARQLNQAEEIDEEAPHFLRSNDNSDRSSEVVSPSSERLAKMRDQLTGLKDRLAESSQKFKDSGVIDKAKENAQTIWKKTWDFLMNASSAILDFVYGLIYRNSPHKIKRFQGSTRKKNLQVLLIVLVFALVFYMLFFRGLFGGNPNDSAGTNTTTTQGNTQAETKTALQTKYNLLKSYADTAQVESFNQTYTSLEADIQTASNSNFQDTVFLKTLDTNADNLYYQIFDITPIKKADISFTELNNNENLVDFSNVDNDVYIIDKAKSQILKGNPGGLSLDVFASDAELTAMSHIVCAGTSCYITDDNLGLVILNLQTKTFSKFTSNAALKAAGQGVEQLGIYSVQNTTYVYALKPSESKVIRYTRSGEGFKAPETWNKAAGFDTSVEDFAIDGGIFELSSSGEVRRFFGGNIDGAFAGITPPTKPFGTNLQIAITPARASNAGNINRMYIADSDNARIVVYEKDLNTNKQYTFKGSYQYDGEELGVSLKNIKQISLSTNEKILYVLSGNKVFSISVSAI